MKVEVNHAEKPHVFSKKYILLFGSVEKDKSVCIDVV